MFLFFNSLHIETWVTCPMSESVVKSHQWLLMCIVFLWLLYCTSQALFVLLFWSASLGFNPLSDIRIEWKTMRSRGGFGVLMYCWTKPLLYRYDTKYIVLHRVTQQSVEMVTGGRNNRKQPTKIQVVSSIGTQSFFEWVKKAILYWLIYFYLGNLADAFF